MVNTLALLALGGLAAAAPRPATDIPAIETTAPRGTEPGAAPTRVSPDPTGPTTHGPYSGTATTTGAEKAPTTIALSIDSPPPAPTHSYYNANGKLSAPAPLPYTPGGMCLVLRETK
jgi:hypothetical protein